jgi:hypothetical protein
MFGLIVAGASCQAPATDDSGGSNTGGTSSATGGKGMSSTGGKPSTGGSSGSTTGTGGSTPTPGGGGSSGSGGGAGGSGDNTGGSSGTGGSAAGGESGDAGPGAGGAGGSGPVTSGGTLPTCSGEPAATVPGLKKTQVAKLPGGDQAGQVIGVPGEKGIYIIGHRSGKVFYAVDGKLDPTPMATVAVKNNAGQDEQGLLGIALHPKFKDNQLFYLLYTAPSANIHIQELKRTGMTSSMDSKTIWDHARAAGGAFHNGGQIFFNGKDPDKTLLYHSVGNNLSTPQSGTPAGFAGRVMVHDVSAGMSMGPTVSFGLRNPYRMMIDRANGDMYIGEIDDAPGGALYVTNLSNPTKDFGYRGGGVKAGLTGKEGQKALIGGMVYRGMGIPGLCGRYFYASWPDGGIKSIVVKDGKLVGAASAHAGLGTGGISSFGEDGDGELYFSNQAGEVYKIEAM